MKKDLGELFKKIVFAVVQSGTALKDNENKGVFDEDRLKEQLSICSNFGVLSKEHNGDFLSPELISRKFSLGLYSLNVAPELGRIETGVILGLLNEDQTERFFRICYDSGKWQKWVSYDFMPYLNKKTLMETSGHYVFSNKELKEFLRPFKEFISKEVEKRIHAFIDRIVL